MFKRFSILFSLLLVLTIFIGCSEGESITELLADLQTPPEQITVKIFAAQKLADIKDPTAIPYLIEALGDANPQVREAIANTLVIYAKEMPDETIPHLKENLASNNETIRNEIMGILARVGKPAIPTLRQALNSNNSFVKLSAIRILGEIGDKSVIYDLIQVLDGTKNENIQVLCAISLANLKSPAAIDSLQKLLSNSKDFNVRVSAIKAIGDLDAKDSAILLIKLLPDKDVQDGVKVEALRALKKMEIDNPTLKKNLLKLVESNNESLRMEAIYYLYTLGDKRGMKFLYQDIDEDYPAQAQLAIITLGRTKDQSKETNAALKKALKFEDMTLRIMAAKALEECGDNTGREVIINCLRECENSGNRLVAIDYIGELGLKEASPLLMEELRTTKDFSIIKGILDAIEALNLKEAVPDLKNKYIELANQPELKIVIVELLVKFHTDKARKAFQELLKYEKDKDRYFHYEITNILEGW